MRGEDRGLGGIGLGVKLRAQGFELAARFVDGLGEQLLLALDAVPFLVHDDLRALHLEDRADGQSRRGGDAEEHIRIGAARARRRLGDLRDRGRRGRGRGRAAFVAEPVGDELAELFHRLLRVRAFRHDHDLVAAPDFERHDRRDAARVREALAELQLHLALKALRDIREHRRGTRVQAGRIRHEHGVGSHRRAFARARRRRRRSSSVSVSRRSAPAFTVPLARSIACTVSPFAMTTCVSRLFACVATWSRSNSMSGAPASTLIAHLHPRREARALQRHGVDADVHEHFHAARRAQRERVRRRVQVRHFTRARRAQAGVGGIDGNAVADELLREDRIGHAFERINDAGERRLQDKQMLAHFA